MSDYTNWHVGMEVICIDDRFDNILPGETAPVAGRAYIIRTISRCPNTGFIGIRVAEIFNPNTLRNCDDTGSNEWGSPHGASAQSSLARATSPSSLPCSTTSVSR